MACPIVKGALLWILKWCFGMDKVYSKVDEALNFAANWAHCPKKEKIVIAIMYECSHAFGRRETI